MTSKSQTKKKETIPKEKHGKIKMKRSNNKNILDKYIKTRDELLENAYDDNYGITLRRKDYQEQIKEIQGIKKQARRDKFHLRVAKRDLKEFQPQWFAYEEVIQLIQIMDEYIDQHKLKAKGNKYNKIK